RIQYSYKMKSLIDYWRKEWGNKDLPFYYVQIAPYFYSKAKDRPYTIYSEAEFWEAQAAALKIPNTAMISTLDLNNDPADLHPVNKWDVGKRFANATISKTYKKDNAIPMGPLFTKMKKEGNSLVLDFEYVGKGLVSKNKDNSVKGFELEDANHNWIVADAIIKNNKVYVSSDKVSNPIAVRYAWREDATPYLYNKDGLPALSFRSDNSLIKDFNVK
ncbi:MAG: sialate O-acetylesterase, partial [Pseudopedobacter saltans]